VHVDVAQAAQQVVDHRAVQEFVSATVAGVAVDHLGDVLVANQLRQFGGDVVALAPGGATRDSLAAATATVDASQSAVADRDLDRAARGAWSSIRQTATLEQRAA
jgi:hypothetical protein